MLNTTYFYLEYLQYYFITYKIKKEVLFHMTTLYIAEKPDMGRKIASALALPHKNGQGYIETGEGIVTWCIGHIMESFEPPDYDPNWKKWDFSVLPMIPPT